MNELNELDIPANTGEAWVVREVTELTGQALPQQSIPRIRTAVTRGGGESHHPSGSWGPPAQRLTYGQKSPSAAPGSRLDGQRT